ncbi:MAG: molybdenum cofactor cytidylyltransferase [Anaerolineae bacterium]
MKLRDALGIRRGEVVAFVGAGGKTSALFRLGHELAAEGWRVLATTTTRMAAEELRMASSTLALGTNGHNATVKDVWRQLNRYGFVLTYNRVSRGKVIGLAPNAVEWLIDRVNSDALLIEADGARRLPFKAPQPHEPVVPDGTTLMVPVAGVDVIGQPLDEEHVYNPERLNEIYGFALGAPVYAAWVAQALRHEDIGLRGAPERARVIPFLNKADDGVMRARARAVARIALRTPEEMTPGTPEEGAPAPRIAAVAIGSARRPDPVWELHQRVGAVVVAAGCSTRMGQPKVLLPWDRGTVIEEIVNRLRGANLSEIVVVTGHAHERVEAALAGHPVRFAYNPDYAAGEMTSSVQAGIRALSPATSACLLVLGDQPLLRGRVIWRVLNAYARGLGRIVAPSYRKRRGHPVLIDKAFWPALLALGPDGAPRDVVRANADAVHHVVVDTDWVLRDIDTPEDYERALRDAGLR